jgi:DNA helicase-2/ATP-dependent DNA helicase PcrA
MSDESVRSALRSASPLVVVEAPGGCGKTHQGASYARDAALPRGQGRILILTHTHAACSVFSGRTRDVAAQVEIRTIDSLIAQLSTAYHLGLGLPPDPALWARQNRDGHDWLAVKAAALLRRYPGLAQSLACRYPIIICDEHQDSNGERHALIMALHQQGAKLRIFADPMQSVFTPKVYIGGCPALDWAALTGAADRFEQLDRPHRWNAGSPELGAWVLRARAALQRGEPVDLRRDLPAAVTVIRADNQARRALEFRPAAADRRPIDAFANAAGTLMVLTYTNAATRSLRSFFNRQIPLWEGHRRDALETYVDALTAANGNGNAVAAAVVNFMQSTCIGFTQGDFANSFTQDVREGCVRRRRNKPAKLQELARLIVAEPDHRGASKVLAALAELRRNDANFRPIQVDGAREFFEAGKLGTFETPDAGFAEISHRRTYTRPSPPPKSISTIHKAKGLECQNVIVAPCDADSFGDDNLSRCLLYVAISRPTHQLMLVVPRANPSPLLLV